MLSGVEWQLYAVRGYRKECNYKQLKSLMPDGLYKNKPGSLSENSLVFKLKK